MLVSRFAADATALGSYLRSGGAKNAELDRTLRIPAIALAVFVVAVAAFELSIDRPIRNDRRAATECRALYSSAINSEDSLRVDAHPPLGGSWTIGSGRGVVRIQTCRDYRHRPDLRNLK